MTKRRWREGVGLTALNVFFIALCFLTLIPDSLCSERLL